MSDQDFTFAWEGADAEAAWMHLRVAHFTGHEALSAPTRYEITLAAKNGFARVLPHELVGQRCALRIATLSEPRFKIVNGIVAEAEELDRTEDANVFRVVLVSPWSRAQHRRRCRIFLDKTIREIIDAVLVGDEGMTRDDDFTVEEELGGSRYAPASEHLAWRVADTSRIDAARARPYVVQYNESDFAFVSRLLEEEGIAYHFEDGPGACLLVLSDTDAGRPRLAPRAVGAIAGREISAFRGVASLRSSGVLLNDYNWKKPSTDMDAPAGSTGNGALVDYRYPGGYPDTAAQGEPLAHARLQRFNYEASHTSGAGLLRVLSAGSIFALASGKPRLQGEHLVTSLDVVGEQHGVLASHSKGTQTVPFTATFTCARRGTAGEVDESHYRPALATPKPRIAGTQTALVTADPGTSGAEINVGGPDGLSIGCVRLRFHWDHETSRLAKEPSSCWVRSSQPFAGGTEGGVWHPRVGVECIVEFEEGDPDRPIITGRVYNGANLPPYGGAPTISTFKSFSTPGGAVHNEFTYHDDAGSEVIHQNAGKDMKIDVGNNRTETIAANGTMTVGADNSETIGSDHTVNIGVHETITIGANDTTNVGANSTTTVGANCVLTVGATETRTIGAAQTITVGGTHTETVGAAVTETYGATHDLTVSAAVTYSIGATRTVNIGAAHDQTFGPHSLSVSGTRSITCPVLTTTINGMALQTIGGDLETHSGAHTLTADAGIFYFTPEFTAESSTGEEIESNSIEICILAMEAIGAEATATGGSLSASGAEIEIVGALSEISGPSHDSVGTTAEMAAIEIHTKGVSMEADGIAIFL